MNLKHYQIQVLNGLQLKQYLNQLSDIEFNSEGYYKGMHFLNKKIMNLKELQPLNNDKYILLIDLKESEHNIVGIVNLQNINKPYYYESKKYFNLNEINIKWELDYIEIRNDYQNQGLVKLLLQGIPTAILSNESLYITNFTSKGTVHHLNNVIEKELPNYNFYLITKENKNISKFTHKAIITLKEYNTLLEKNLD